MLRCRRLYSALREVTKILQLLLKAEEIYSEKGVKKILGKYEGETDKLLDMSDETAIVKSMQFMMRLYRRIKAF